MDEGCREIDYLPYVRGSKDKELYCDYTTEGSLRRSEIYDLDRLIELAQEQLDESA